MTPPTGARTEPDPLPGLRKQLAEEYGGRVPAETIDLVALQVLGEPGTPGSTTSCRSSRGVGHGFAPAAPPDRSLEPRSASGAPGGEPADYHPYDVATTLTTGVPAP